MCRGYLSFHWNLLGMFGRLRQVQSMFDNNYSNNLERIELMEAVGKKKELYDASSH